MISTRRSFVKALSAIVGAIPLPGMVQRLVESVTPEEATLEDAEAILRGLVDRCRSGPIDDREATLVASFLKRMRASDIEVQAFQHAHDTTRLGVIPRADEKVVPFDVRFIVDFMRGTRRTSWFSHNFRTLNAKVMPQVVDTFNRMARLSRQA